MQKVTYRTYIGHATANQHYSVLYDTISFSANNNIYSSYIQRYNLFDFNKYQNLIFGNLFYFILYLCTLEIAPISSCII
jgi:hypothetical protein